MEGHTTHVSGQSHHEIVASVNAGRLLTIRDLSARLAVSVDTAHKLRARGVLPPAVKIGGSVRWEPEVVDAWIAAQRESH